MSNENQPMFVQFARALRDRLADAGIEVLEDKTTPTGLPQNKNWVRIELAPTAGKAAGQKVYVPQAKGGIARVESTLDLEPDPRRGVLPLPNPTSGKPYSNGRIRSHLVPDVEKVSALLIDAVYDGVPPPNRRMPTVVAHAPALQANDEQPEEQNVRA